MPDRAYVFEPDRIPKIRKMILSKTVEGRVAALDELLVFQKADFKAMYEALEGRPMTVRYLDPPLHEFYRQRKKTSRHWQKICT